MSSSSMLKKVSLILLFMAFTGCQSLKTREDVKKDSTGKTTQTGKTPSRGEPENVGRPPLFDSDEEIEENPVVTLPPPPAPVIPKLPKIGIILGGGGALSYAHVGFLKELHRLKVPVAAISGLEFSAPIAALYAKKSSVNDVEWQMFKLKEDDIFKKSFLGTSQKNETKNNRQFFNTAFDNMKVNKFDIPFACPAINYKTSQVMMMNGGPVGEVMATCMSYPPYFKIHQGFTAALRDVTSVANYLRQRGANHIVFVNVLAAPNGSKSFVGDINGADNILWSEIAMYYRKPIAGVDTAINLDAGNFSVTDFEKRRDIMSRGADSAAKQLKKLIGQWGL